MAADLSLSGCGDELAQASVPSLSPTKAEKPAATITGVIHVLLLYITGSNIIVLSL